MRHNEVRDLFGSLMAETCNDVQIEPLLQPLDEETFPNTSTTTDSDARLDIKASGFWGPRFSRTFFDVKIFNPLAKTCPMIPKEAYRYHEELKKLKYERRIIDVENSTLTPLIFACTGGAGPSASRAMKELAKKLAERRETR